MKTHLLLLLAIPSLASSATIDDLWITEVVPSTGQVEVTNVGDGPLTTSSALPFCHRFSYGDAIPSGTTFLEGESKVFAVNLSNAADSDLWLYRVGVFGTASNIITGLDWGGGLNGRSGLATPTKWDGVALPVPAGGMALHLVVADPTKSTSWALGAADLGSHSFPLGPLGLQLGAEEIELDWEGGSPPFRVQGSTGLDDWENLTGLLDQRSHVVERHPSESRQFFRVMDQAVLEETAEYRITFTSLWSTDRFATVPGSAHFSGLIGGMHNDSVSFWSPGTLASTGIENMAELGSKGTLTNEVNTAITAGTAEQVLSGGSLGGAPSETTHDFTATRSHPLITITSMVAPSPDWFVGLHGESLLKENDDWVEILSFDLLAYDAGTEDGTGFSLNNDPTVPADPVSLIPASLPAFAPASGPVGDPIPIARMVIERMD
ncbi:spondin domain-containing protein [Haloferula sp.]|uniref:spondin domain-containing protein n=1 Tax=Haloferula sp. TaxID=2497595 RepID=UPI00329D4FB9